MMKNSARNTAIRTGRVAASHRLTHPGDAKARASYGTLPCVPHHDVWLAAAASAPVIALANLVAIGDSYNLRRLFTQHLERSMPVWRLTFTNKGSRTAFWVYLIATGNLLVQAIVTGAAFRSLVDPTYRAAADLIPPAETLGILACLFCALFLAGTRYEHERGSESPPARNRRPSQRFPAESATRRQPAWLRTRNRKARQSRQWEDD